jgi:hypothetical protein
LIIPMAMSTAQTRYPVQPLTCLQCGTVAHHGRAARCRRCGLAYGEPPRQTGGLASCPVCYRTTDDDGRLPSLSGSAYRVHIVEHIAEHEAYPVGDDEYLETLRRGDRIVIDRWEAPFDVVRRYLVTGVIDAGRTRTVAHGVIVTAMSQLSRSRAAGELVGDDPEWRAAREAISGLMERYHRRRL